jgi:hypothetical protein
MKAALFLIVLALALPLTAFADGIVLTNQNGSIAISMAGISSSGSQLMSFNGIVAPLLDGRSDQRLGCDWWNVFIHELIVCRDWQGKLRRTEGNNLQRQLRRSYYLDSDQPAWSQEPHLYPQRHNSRHAV